MNCKDNDITYAELTSAFIRKHANLNTLKLLEGETVSTFWHRFEQQVHSHLYAAKNEVIHYFRKGAWKIVEQVCANN